MLVLFIIIQVPAVLLDTVDAEFGGVHLLSAHTVALEFALDFTLLLAIRILDPNTLYVSTSNDVVPLLVAFSNMGLGFGLAAYVVPDLWISLRNFVPKLARLFRQALDVVLGLVDGFLQLLRQLRGSLKNYLLRG